LSAATSDLKSFILKLAQYSVTAHNSQPFQIEVLPTEVKIYARRERFLPVADPHAKDLRMALGALFETLNIGLSERNLCLEVELLLIGKLVMASDKPLAIFTFRPRSEGPDVLALELPKRFSFRGIFPKNTDVADFDKKFHAVQQGMQKVGLIPIFDEKRKEQLKNAFKEINLRFLTKPGYIEELYSWMRFSTKNPKWLKDGLNAESIALSSVETWGAQYLLRPKIFRFLHKYGLAGALVDESPKIMSAPFLVVIPVAETASDFDKGRAFMRAWLQLTNG
jgi:hypothetical protein